MLRTIKAKNARTKRFIDNRAPKIVENAKTTIIIRGSTTSDIVNAALADLYSLKKPNAVSFTKKNNIHPFEDTQSLEFYSKKNDASLMIIGTHNKKRPHNLTFVRLFDYQVLDKYEFGIENFASLLDFETPKCSIGMKPSIVFEGDWDSSTDLRNMANMFLDFFHGEEIDMINLAGLESVISLTRIGNKIHFRVYTIHLKKSGQLIPRIEILEMGPRMDFVPRRTQDPSIELWKQATKIPREIKPKKVKNLSTDLFGDKFGQLHLQKQDLTYLQTRKMKGLKHLNSKPANSMLADEQVATGEQVPDVEMN